MGENSMDKTSTTPDEQLNHLLENCGKDLPEKIGEPCKKVFIDMIKNGKKVYEAMGFSKEMLESMYGNGYRIYQAGRYEEAIAQFKMLMLLDSNDTRFSLGLAASFQKAGKFSEAVELYHMAAKLDKSSPMPYYYAAECYRQLGELEIGIIALNWALERCGESKDYTVLKDRILIMRESLTSKILENAKGTKLKFTEAKLGFNIPSLEGKVK